jgi:hypothetical protein
MERVIVVIDPAVEVEPAQFAAAWNKDAELAGLARATVEASQPQAFHMPWLVEFVVLPLGVNLVASVLFSAIGVAIKQVRCRPVNDEQARVLRTVEDLHMSMHTSPNGEQIVVVRCRREIG